MAIRQEGSNIVIDASVAGSVFPTTERELVFPVLVDGTGTGVHIEGALYGRSIELRGNVRVDGPIVSRGDTRINPTDSRIKLLSGVTVNGSLNVTSNGIAATKATYSVRDARVLIKGDVAVNQSVALRDALVFGSIRAVNCSLHNTVVLGTCVASEKLLVSRSTIGGYAARDAAFEGRCLLLNALGESRTRPLFLPHEHPDGMMEDSDLRYYPLTRAAGGLKNMRPIDGQSEIPYSQLHPVADWVRARVLANAALNEAEGETLEKWILSIGGRVSNLTAINDSIAGLTRMLKCGFEYEHYHPEKRPHYLASALRGLTADEAWVLGEVCAS